MSAEPVPDPDKLLLKTTDDAAIERDRWGRPMVRGRSYLRPSTVAKSLDGAGGLPAWRGRMVLQGIARDPTLADAAFAAVGDVGRLKVIEARAFEYGGGTRAASIGTELHRLTCRVDTGLMKVSDITDEGLRADVEGYRAALEERGLEPVAAEFFCVNEKHGVAGTCDRLYRTRDGRLIVGDLKTSSSDTKWLLAPTAIQVACYAYGTPCEPDGTELGWPAGFDPRVGALVHLPQGTGRATLHALNLETGRQGLRLALSVRSWKEDIASLLVS